MATFRPVNNVCELSFDDKYFYTLPLSEKTLNCILGICDDQIKALKQIGENDPDAFDKAYNLSLDALDEILGEGAGADIMSIFDEPGLIEVGQVITYISQEYSEKYKAAFPQTRPAPDKRGRR